MCGPRIEMTVAQRAFNKKMWRCKQRGYKNPDMEPFEFDLDHSKKMLRFKWERVINQKRGIET